MLLIESRFAWSCEKIIVNIYRGTSVFQELHHITVYFSEPFEGLMSNALKHGLKFPALWPSLLLKIHTAEMMKQIISAVSNAWHRFSFCFVLVCTCSVSSSHALWSEAFQVYVFHWAKFCFSFESHFGDTEYFLGHKINKKGVEWL